MPIGSVSKSSGRKQTKARVIFKNCSYVLRGCLHDLALPGCNEAWDRFDVLKIAISCGTCLNKIVS